MKIDIVISLRDYIISSKTLRSFRLFGTTELFWSLLTWLLGRYQVINYCKPWLAHYTTCIAILTLSTSFLDISTAHSFDPQVWGIFVCLATRPKMPSLNLPATNTFFLPKFLPIQTYRHVTVAFATK